MQIVGQDNLKNIFSVLDIQLFEAKYPFWRKEKRLFCVLLVCALCSCSVNRLSAAHCCYSEDLNYSTAAVSVYSIT